MKIYSWNVYFKNKHPNQVVDFIKTLDFDVLALQEVDPSVLHALKQIPDYYSIDSGDFEFLSQDGSSVLANLMILSKSPFEKTTVVSFPDEWYAKPWTMVGRLLIRCAAGWNPPYKNKSGLIATLSHRTEEPVQVVCSHFALGIPETRKNEFIRIMEHTDRNVPVIFCGDFNILDTPHAAFSNWLAGSPITDFIFWKRERNIFEKLFKKYGLQNPLRGKVTQDFTRAQLDHILVPNNATIVNKEVLRDRVGSDHNPVMVEVEL